MERCLPYLIYASKVPSHHSLIMLGGLGFGDSELYEYYRHVLEIEAILGR